MSTKFEVYAVFRSALTNMDVTYRWTENPTVQLRNYITAALKDRLGLAIVPLCHGTGAPLRRTQAPPGPVLVILPVITSNGKW